MNEELSPDNEENEQEYSDEGCRTLFQMGVVLLPLVISAALFYETSHIASLTPGALGCAFLIAYFAGVNEREP